MTPFASFRGAMLAMSQRKGVLAAHVVRGDR